MSLPSTHALYYEQVPNIWRNWWGACVLQMFLEKNISMDILVRVWEGVICLFFKQRWSLVTMVSCISHPYFIVTRRSTMPTWGIQWCRIKSAFQTRGSYFYSEGPWSSVLWGYSWGGFYSVCALVKQLSLDFSELIWGSTQARLLLSNHL